MDKANLPSIIMLTGRKHAGKTTVAKFLSADHGYQIMSFAEPLKWMLEAIGVPEANLYGGSKEVPLEMLCGKTARFAMQKLGVEWRNNIGECLWAQIMVRRVREYFEHDAMALGVVVDDARFQYEIDAVRTAFPEKRVEVWRVVNLNQSETKRERITRKLSRNPATAGVMEAIGKRIHSTELWWDVIPADEVILNHGTKTGLRNAMNTAMAARTVKQSG